MSENIVELRDAVITYIQVTGAGITEETKNVAKITDEDIYKAKQFNKIYFCGDKNDR